MFELMQGDCLEVLKTLPDNSVDAVVTDPPYGLGFMGKEWDTPGSFVERKPAKSNIFDHVGGNHNPSNPQDAARTRKREGEVFGEWCEVWAREALRVLKPGGHLASFSSTRTYHRMACAIEDAGFEVRDQLAWVYGQGFPKSLDVSKAIDKRRDWTALPKLQGAIGTARAALGISQSEAARRMGLIGPDEALGGGGFMWFETGMRAPTREQWPHLKATLSIGDEFDACFEEVEREITGVADEWTDRTNYAITSKDGFRRDKPASDLARQWNGWGTALKPAWEPICLARKPLSEKTVAANVLRWGTGAINVGACKIESSGTADPNWRRAGRADNVGLGYHGNGSRTETPESLNPEGRFPANLCHDGSDEVLDLFPESKGDKPHVRAPYGSLGYHGGAAGLPGVVSGHTDTGSAARFFYCAKASKADRAGSKHPTVKPIKLMQWLCRLITPPGGVVLDPFAGSGTTGAAAILEGFRPILIEREDEYVADIRRRLGLHGASDAVITHDTLGEVA